MSAIRNGTGRLYGSSTPEFTRRISRFALQQRSRIDASERAEGPRRLMWAILKDSLCCYHTYARARTVHGQRLFREAERWVQSRDFGWVFSFENVCAVLDIDSDYLRNELRRWQRVPEQQVQGESVWHGDRVETSGCGRETGCRSYSGC